MTLTVSLDKMTDENREKSAQTIENTLETCPRCKGSGRIHKQRIGCWYCGVGCPEKKLKL